uniref:Lipid droplet-associated hydrolase n=1 Tax=Parascaris univalens TaxID=6257 RepID=A0A915BNK4_PARUN
RLLSELMENKYNVVCAVALFPTIERMAESPNGQRLLPILYRLNAIDSLLPALLFWLNLLPIALKRWLCSWYLGADNAPKCITESAVELLDVNVLRNIIYMCIDELKTVGKLDESFIKYTNCVRFYYGRKDNWCPIRLGNEMKRRLGEDFVKIDDANCEHAFVIANNEVVARKVLDWILR